MPAGSRHDHLGARIPLAVQGPEGFPVASRDGPWAARPREIWTPGGRGQSKMRSARLLRTAPASPQGPALWLTCARAAKGWLKPLSGPGGQPSRQESGLGDGGGQLSALSHPALHGVRWTPGPHRGGHASGWSARPGLPVQRWTSGAGP